LILILHSIFLVDLFRSGVRSQEAGVRSQEFRSQESGVRSQDEELENEELENEELKNKELIGG
jgi:hypothetical protein